MSYKLGLCRLLVVIVAGAVICPALPKVAAQFSSIADTVQKLAKIEAPDKEISGEVPAEARTLLKELKHQLRDLVSETLDSSGPSAQSPAALRAEVLKKLGKEGVQTGGSPHCGDFGCVLDIRMEKPVEHPDLLVATTELGIPCGSDTSLYVFKENASKWDLILALEANDYEDFGGAQGLFGYSLSPPDEKKNWFLVATDVGPRCNSVWHGLRYKVVRPGLTAYQPKVLFSQQVGINLDHQLDNKTSYKLAVDRKGFTVRYWGYQGHDDKIQVRLHVDGYTVSEDRVARTPPIAKLPQDFLDEWIELSWEQAVQWTEPASLSESERWHSRLHDRDPGQDMYYSSEFDFVQPCEKDRNKWQIGLSISSQERSDKLPEKLFFTVARKDGLFYLRDISEKRSPGCPGQGYPIDTGKLDVYSRE